MRKRGGLTIPPWGCWSICGALRRALPIFFPTSHRRCRTTGKITKKSFPMKNTLPPFADLPIFPPWRFLRAMGNIMCRSPKARAPKSTGLLIRCSSTSAESERGTLWTKRKRSPAKQAIRRDISTSAGAVCALSSAFRTARNNLGQSA